MRINFVPQRRDDQVVYVKRGDELLIDGEVFDFSPIQDGDLLPQDAIRSQWIAGDASRINGVLLVTLILPNPWNYSPEQAFPAPIVINTDGLIELPNPLPETDTSLPLEIIEEEVADDAE